MYLKKVIKKQELLLDGVSDDAKESEKKAAEKATEWISENQIEIKKIVLNTGIQDQTQTYMKPLGLGFAKEKGISALDNIAYLNSEIMESSREILTRAKGYYKIHMLKSFNPLFWIEFIVFLPKEILKYLGIPENEKISSLIIRIFQLIYWGTSIYFMYQSYLQSLK
ncbi:MAG: hypothetical protein IPJ03_06210 [Ignavibacteriales bacterium]|nr:hypothetical protein [Ignavibacteriales bacterium]